MGTGNKALVSTDGGRDAIWSRDGRTLFYGRSIELMAASVSTAAGSMNVGKRERLFPFPNYSTGAHANYDVSPDGRSFAVVSGGPTAKGLEKNN